MGAPAGRHYLPPPEPACQLACPHINQRGHHGPTPESRTFHHHRGDRTASANRPALGASRLFAQFLVSRLERRPDPRRSNDARRPALARRRRAPLDRRPETGPPPRPEVRRRVTPPLRSPPHYGSAPK